MCEVCVTYPKALAPEALGPPHHSPALLPSGTELLGAAVTVGPVQAPRAARGAGKLASHRNSSD